MIRHHCNFRFVSYALDEARLLYKFVVRAPRDAFATTKGSNVRAFASFQCTLYLPAIMEDESREEIPRISIDSLRDWHRMKSNFTSAVFELFDQRIRQNGLESERASFLPHLQQAREIVVLNQGSMTDCLLSSSSIQPSKRRNPMCVSMERSSRR